MVLKSIPMLPARKPLPVIWANECVVAAQAVPPRQKPAEHVEPGQSPFTVQAQAVDALQALPKSGAEVMDAWQRLPTSAIRNNGAECSLWKRLLLMIGWLAVSPRDENTSPISTAARPDDDEPVVHAK